MPVRSNGAQPPIPSSYSSSASSGLDTSVHDGSDTAYTGYGLSHAQHLDNKAPDIESIPLTEYAERDKNPAGRRNAKRKGRLEHQGGFWSRVENITGLEQPFLLLLFHGIVSLLWGVTLAVFAAGVVPLHFVISEFAKRHDADWTNEIVALVGLFATMHITYVLQLALELYSHIILAGEFTLGDLKWMQGVNEVTLFAEFPPRPGGPPKIENPRGFMDHLRVWWGAFYRWCDNRRLAWILVYLGMALHTTSVVSILQPEEYWQHVVFNDKTPCGVEPGAVPFETILEGNLQLAMDKLSLDVGRQLGSYPDQVSANTTTAHHNAMMALSLSLT